MPLPVPASGKTCQRCGTELTHVERFGSIDPCLSSTGLVRFEDQSFKKRGNLYRCDKCEGYYHDYDGEGVLHPGYVY